MNRVPTARLLISVALLLVLVLAGCKATGTQSASTAPSQSASPAATTAKPTSAPAGPYGNLRVAQDVFRSESLDPVPTSKTEVASLLAPMVDFLINLDKDARHTPGIAEKWELAPDGLSWTLRIRKNVKFHNGDDLTAADVKFSLERYKATNAYYSEMRNSVDRIDLVDDSTVRVYTKGKQPFFPNYLEWRAPNQGVVTPKNYIEKNGIEYFQSRPVGSGPFKFSRYVPGDLYEYEANTGYWGKVPAFKTLTTILIPEEGTRVALLKTGGVDIITGVGIDTARDLEAAGFRTANSASMLPLIIITGAYLPEGAKLPTANVKVRQALSLAFNRDEVKKTLFYGQADAVMPPFMGGISQDIDVPYWKNVAANAYRYDVEQAKQLLKEAGYPNGFTLKIFTFAITGAPYLDKLAEITAAYWGRIGVKAEIVPTSQSNWNTMRTAMQQSRPSDLVGQASTLRYPVYPNPIQGLKYSFHSTGGTLAQFGKAMPDVDKLLDGASNETDVAKRKEMVAKTIQTAVDTYTVYPLLEGPGPVAFGPKIDADFPKDFQTVHLVANTIRHKG